MKRYWIKDVETWRLGDLRHETLRMLDGYRASAKAMALEMVGAGIECTFPQKTKKV